MKTYILYLTIPVIILACNSTDKKQNDSTATDFKTLDTIVPFPGFWVNEIYLKNIERTKSPRECQNVSESCIRIPARTLQATSMVSNFHEGAAEMIVLKNRNKYQFYYRYGDTIRNLAYDIQIISNEKIKIGKNTFIKTNEKFLEDKLFSGEYLDSAGAKVQFLKDGHITGLGAFTTYAPVYDYLGPGMEVDLVDLGESPEKMTDFGFKFNKDTLLVYKLNCLIPDSTDNTCLKVDFGDLKYRLIKTH